MRFRSIGFKLTLWYTGMLTLTFVFFTLTVYGLLAYSLSHDMDYALNSIGDVMAQKASAEGKKIYPKDVDELFRRFFGFSPLERHFGIFDPEEIPDKGRRPGLSEESRISPEALDHASRGKRYFETVSGDSPYPVRLLNVPVIVDGQLTHLVRVGMPLENMYKTRHRFLLIIAAVFPLGLVLAGGGGWLLARRALRPVDEMTQTAKKISGEDLDQRLQETGNGDELDRLARTLNNMLDRFHEAIEQMRQFSADASHELQTPLTILKGEMEVALRQPRSPEEYQRILGSGLEEIDRINHLVAGLLLLARADAGVLRLDMQSIELLDFVADILQQMKPIANSHSVDLRLEAPDPVTISGDREHLRRLQFNLISNAIKYSDQGKSVSVEILSQGQWTVLKIRDEGRGIAPDEQKQIFNRFYRATRTGSRDRDGIGLGLSIASSIVKAHGGRIELVSGVNHGSTFSVYLPR
jgi:heavy metal sensor kinase